MNPRVTTRIAAIKLPTEFIALERTVPKPKLLIIDGAYVCIAFTGIVATKVTKTCVKIRGFFTVLQISCLDIWR